MRLNLQSWPRVCGPVYDCITGQVLYIERHLAWPVVVPDGEELRLNYSHEIRVLLREIEVILRMELPVPIVASALLSRRQYLVDSANSVQVSSCEWIGIHVIR